MIYGALEKFETNWGDQTILVKVTQSLTPIELLKTVEAVFDYDGDAQRYQFGYFGYFSYEMIRRFEDVGYKQKYTSLSDVPEMAFDIYATTIQFDLETQSCRLVRALSPYWVLSPLDLSEIDQEMFEALDDGSTAKKCRLITKTMAQEQFYQHGSVVMDHIAKGDVYQLQLGHEIVVDSDVAPYDVYKRMRDRNPAPYMYLAPFGAISLIGASPEVFVKLEGEKITMRPIAGTVARGDCAEENKRRNEVLLNDEKELAEHLMLVDLCRNDIGRVAQPKSLDVTELMRIEEYSHVNHIVSNIIADIAPEFDKYNLLCKTFPAGTMTGTPKVRAMEIIEQLEHTTRAAYSGFVGLIDFKGFTNTALIIRTTSYAEGRYSLRASAGFVADSTLEGEWKETLAKLAVVYWAVTGEELNE